ncbi:hypothetical protein BDZ91DRAFT_825591 [Kalaharituber pfeilii]|nr:hypothetical protein BDZ91DRAFT_825591 [Kalaharituber pfeilii]
MDNMNGVLKINSLQNMFLLKSDVLQLFHQYLISVNPNGKSRDNFDVVAGDFLRLGGQVLNPACTDPHHLSDELVRWHFTQSVLTHMREVEEPKFRT